MNQVPDLSIEILEYDFSKKSLKNIEENKWVKNQWPLVYFIKNNEKKIAYIGESTDGFNRINSHLNNPQRASLNKVSIIGCDKFNKSATLDIEAHLIQYISSEGTFELQNGNNGLSHHNYYQRDMYKNIFVEIWDKLIAKKLVSRSLKEVENSNFFKYSPYKSLNQDQYNSVLEIIGSLNKNSANHIFVKGVAGTGKTILATYLIKLLTSKYEELNVEEIEPEEHQEIELLKEFRTKYTNPVIGLVIAVTPLRTTIKKVFDRVPGLSSKMVISPTEAFKKKYDILIVDEAHRLRQRRNISFMKVFTANNKKIGLENEGTELDWVIANSKNQIFFYDAGQSVKPSDVMPERFQQLLSKETTIKLELTSQMRVNAGSDYITFVDNLLNCKLKTSDKYVPENYELKVFDSFQSLHKELKIKNQKYELCRLVAGYAWPWVTKNKKSKKKHDIEIEGLRFCWNKTDKDWIASENSFLEVGCIHTTQGYDLNYVGIIFGREIIYDPESRTIKIVPENYFDRNGKAGIKDPDILKQYIINIYKTLMYRGARGTYIYACDKNLQSYLEESIHLAAGKLPFKILENSKVVPFVNCVPIFDIKVAAGNFSSLQRVEDFEWVELSSEFNIDRDHFVCQVFGESMNKKIPNGSWCLFRKDSGGTREGKIVLVENYKIQDADFGAGFTIKLYHSEKAVSTDSWLHTTIRLQPFSDDSRFKEIVLEEDELSPLKVVGIFVDVIK